MISETAYREAERVKNERAELEAETEFANAYQVCPRCGGPLRPGFFRVLKCRPCKRWWKDDSGGVWG